MIFPFDPNKPPVCDLCKQAPAAIQFVEQRGTETRKISICQGCAAKQGVSQDGNSLTFNLPSLLAAMSGITGMSGAQMPEPVCPGCGMTVALFREGGRLGCARCYEVFEELIRPIIKRAQAGEAHRGLAPARLAPTLEKAEIHELRRQLEEHVRAEKYEDAARIRDRIRELEKQS